MSVGRRRFATLKEVVQSAVLIDEKVEAFCRLAREGNARRQRNYERRCSVFIVGRFAYRIDPEPEPKYQGESWYTDGVKILNALKGELDVLSGEDVPHWGSEEARQISREVVSTIVASQSGRLFPL